MGARDDQHGGRGRSDVPDREPDREPDTDTDAEAVDGRDDGRDGMPLGGAVQESLPFDEPVPYRLTTEGRRLVAPGEEPLLRVVAGQPPRTRVDGDAVDLEGLDAAERARARAMRRGGMHTLDIAERLDVDPLHVEQWVVDLPVPRDVRRRRLRPVPSTGAADPEAARGAARAAVVTAWQVARDEGRTEAERRLAADPSLRSGLGLVAGVLEQDHHALLLTGDDLELVAAAWHWTVATLEVATGPVRVLVRHDPRTAGDRVARDVAASLDVGLGAITTTRDVGRTGQPAAVRIRVAEPVLAGRVAGWRRALLVSVTTPRREGADAGAS